MWSDVTRQIKLHSLLCLLRFPTGLGIKESDTRKTLVSSKKKPTCTLRELPWMRLMHPHMEAKQIHPQLQTLQVRQEVPGSAQLFDMYLLSVRECNQADRSLAWGYFSIRASIKAVLQVTCLWSGNTWHGSQYNYHSGAKLCRRVANLSPMPSLRLLTLSSSQLTPILHLWLFKLCIS